MVAGERRDSWPRLSGKRCKCMACGALFNSVSVFDAHRVGDWGDRGADRRCLTSDEMLRRGWLVNAKGFWISRRRPDRAAGSGVRAAPDPVQRVQSVGDCIDVVKP